MKRKSDSDIDLIDNELITKSLRRSVSNFLNENSINMSVLSEKFVFFNFLKNIHKHLL